MRSCLINIPDIATKVLKMLSVQSVDLTLFKSAGESLGISYVKNPWAGLHYHGSMKNCRLKNANFTLLAKIMLAKGNEDHIMVPYVLNIMVFICMRIAKILINSSHSFIHDNNVN